MGQIQPASSLCKESFMETEPYLFVYTLAMVAFGLQTTQMSNSDKDSEPAKSKIFTIWLSSEKVCWPLIYTAAKARIKTAFDLWVREKWLEVYSGGGKTCAWKRAGAKLLGAGHVLFLDLGPPYTEVFFNLWRVNDLVTILHLRYTLIKSPKNVLLL